MSEVGQGAIPEEKAGSSDAQREQVAFTPGPWWVLGKSTVAAPLDGKTWQKSRRICECHALCELPTAEDEANARLIAAAPDLYAALVWALEVIESHAMESISGLGEGIYDLFLEDRENAESALKKARGDT